jgi:glycosyltransferase involved in cell wall biosynthesis
MNDSRMSVLFILNEPAIFNSESRAREHMRAYAREIGVLHVLSRGSGPDYHEDLGDGKSLTLHAIDWTKWSGKPPFLFKTLRMCAHKIIQDEHIEIVSAENPFEYGFVALKAIKGTNAKLHVQVYTDPFSKWFTRVKIIYSSEVKIPAINRVRQSIANRVLPKAHGIRVVSKRVEDSLIARFGNRIVAPHVIPVEIPTEIPPQLPLPPHTSTFTLITISRLEPEKRIQDILLALARIHRRYPSAGVVIVGEGSQRKNLEKYAKRLELNEKVKFLGHIDNAWGMMPSAQAYIQASGYEGYSRTLIEAALARIPIITSDVGLVGEVFKGYEEVLAVPPGDPSALATAIIGLIEDNEARTQYVINAEKAVREYLANTHVSPADIAQDLRNTLTPST